MSLAPVFSSKSVFPSLLHIKQLTENDHCTVAAEGPWLGHSGCCPWAAGNSIQFAGNLVPSERILLSSLHYQWFPQCLYFHEKKLRESNYFRRPDLDEIMLKLRHSTNVLGAFHEQGLEMKPWSRWKLPGPSHNKHERQWKGSLQGGYTGWGFRDFQEEVRCLQRKHSLELILKVNKFSLKGPDSWSVSQIFIITSWPKCSHSNT